MTELFPIQAPVDESKSIFLKGNVPSSKNNKEIGFYYLPEDRESNWKFKMVTTNYPDGKWKFIQPNLRNSKAAEEYIEMIVVQIIENRQKFLRLIKDKPLPLKIQLHFVKKTRTRWDFHNMVQIIGDCITGSYWKDHKTIPHVATQWIPDDDVSNVLFLPPLEGPVYSVDKDNPGVWITVL